MEYKITTIFIDKNDILNKLQWYLGEFKRTEGKEAQKLYCYKEDYNDVLSVLQNNNIKVDCLVGEHNIPHELTLE